MLIPRRVKHRKQHHPGRSGAATGGTKIAFGDFGIQALEPAYVTNRQIEAARIAMTRYMKRGGKVWINIYPDRPLTKKPAETRMGSGKGSPEWWISNVKPGRVLFELAGVPEDVAREALRLAMHRLPISCVASMTTVWSTSCARPRKSCSTCASSPLPASWRTTVVCVRSERTSPGSIQRCTSGRSASVEPRRLSDQND